MIKKTILTDQKTLINDKNGNPLKTKDGRPYTRLLIKTSDYGDKQLSGFQSEWNKNWKIGEEITIEVNKVEKDGREYLNFDKVNLNERLMEMVQNLLKRVENLEHINAKGYAYPESNTKVEDITFDPSNEPPLDSYDEQYNAM